MVTSYVDVNFCVICIFLLLFCAPPPLLLADFITIPLFLVLFSKLSTARQQFSNPGLGSGESSWIFSHWAYLLVFMIIHLVPKAL